ncbi:MAG: hypothetical protein Q8K20_05930, partial [Gemmobacter sp.]|nr:hypothetical protein [Gemmobacter sp.]
LIFGVIDILEGVDEEVVERVDLRGKESHGMQSFEEKGKVRRAPWPRLRLRLTIVQPRERPMVPLSDAASGD